MNKQELLSIKRGLDRLSKQINSHLEGKTFSFQDMTPHEKSEHILEGSCDFFGIKRQDLFKKNNLISRKKKYIIALLNEYTPIGREEMASLVGYTEQSSATSRIRNMEEKLSGNPWSDGRMKSIYYHLVEYLGLPKSKLYQ